MGVARGGVKHPFDFWYVWVPTGSSDPVDSTWPTGSISASINGNDSLGITNGLYDQGFFLAGIQSTRAVPLIDPADAPNGGNGQTTPDEGALPKGSSAIDFLWNVRSLSSSYHEYTTSTGGRIPATLYWREWRFTYNTESFNYFNIGGNPANKFGWLPFGYGVKSYPVTSSWITYEPKMYESDFTWSLNSVNNSFTAPKQLISGSVYAKPTARNEDIPSWVETPFVDTNLQTILPDPGYQPTNLTYTNDSTGSNDGRFFDLAGGCGITRADVGGSLFRWNLYKTDGTLSGRHLCTTELKNRRLYFPTIATGSSNIFTQTGSAAIGTEWVVEGPTNQVFDENGGIYNVKFNLKRDIANDFYPDTGAGSELLVYIFNVDTVIPKAGNLCVPGDNGYYPPDNNIVRIKNVPAMTFVNPATGYLIESFNINVTQYGTPAQLVFEASGSLSDGRYFGCIIDDVSFCKVGVSTDPNMIKPTTTGEQIGKVGFDL